MAKDRYLALDRCAYCGRPGSVVWAADLHSCRNEVCLALAYGELRRRGGPHHRRPELPRMRPTRRRVKVGQ